MSTKVCITPEQEIELEKAIAKGDFSLTKIQKTKSSSERFALIDRFIGNEDVSKKIVREMEKRIHSKKETIVEDYITRTLSSSTAETRKGVINKFKRMSQFLGAKEEKDFLEELVAHKFGAYITKEEANNFEKLTNEAIVLKEKIPADATDITPESRAYGEKIVELENAESRILMERTGIKFSDYKKIADQKGLEKWASRANYLVEGTGNVAGATRSFLATGEISAVLRQGWRLFSGGLTEAGINLATGKPSSTNIKLKIWKNLFTNTLKAVKETGKYGDHRFYDAVRAEIHAHPNSYNGVFDAAENGFGLRAGVEEQFPSSFPSEMYDKYLKNTLGNKANIFKMSEVAFNAVMLKSRFELANHTISVLKNIDGVNMMDKKYANPAGEFVSGFTGRGGLLGAEKNKQWTDLFNKILFAPRFMASQFSPYYQIATGLTTRIDNPASRFAVQQNVQFLIGSVALLIGAEFIRSLYSGEDLDWNALHPQSNTFGKVELLDTERSLDLTGGNRSVVGLMTGLSADKYYDDRLGIWRKKNMFQTTDGKPYYDFISGKYAPVPAVLRDLMKGEHFGGEEISANQIVKNLLIPITYGNVLAEAITKDDLSVALLVAGAEGVGIGTSDIRFKPQSDEWSALLNTDKKAYWKAVGELWENVQTNLKTYRTDEAFQALPEDKKRERIEKMYNRELDKVIHQEEYRVVSKDKLKEIKDKREEF